MSSAARPNYFQVEEYLDTEEKAITKSEYVDGWVRAMTGASLRHNIVSANAFVSLSTSLRGKDCRPFNSDTKVRIERDSMKRFYYPDLQVVCESNDQLSVFQDRPVLIIEVLSPSTRRYDLDEDGFLREVIDGIGASIHLPFLGCSLSMREIYEGVEFSAECVQESETEYDASSSGRPRPL